LKDNSRAPWKFHCKALRYLRYIKEEDFLKDLFKKLREDGFPGPEGLDREGGEISEIFIIPTAPPAGGRIFFRPSMAERQL
jgi:hypothetical protein